MDTFPPDPPSLQACTPPTEAQQAIRQLLAAGLNQVRIAKGIGLSPAAVCKLATGRARHPRSSTVDALRGLLARQSSPPGPGVTPMASPRPKHKPKPKPAPEPVAVLRSETEPSPDPVPGPNPQYRGWTLETHGAHWETGVAGLARVIPPEGADEDEIQLRVDVGRSAVVVGRASGLDAPVELSVPERQQLRERLGLRWAYIDAFAWAMERLRQLRAGTLTDTEGDAP